MAFEARRVVITAQAQVSACGAAEILRQDGPDFTVGPHGQTVCAIRDADFKAVKGARHLSRGGRLLLEAGLRAAAASGLNDFSRAGLFAGVGPNLDIAAELPEIHAGQIMAEQTASPLWLLKFLPNTASGLLARELGLHGPSLTIANACAASLTAIGQAYQAIRLGQIDLALAGGGDSRLSSGGVLAYRQAGVLSSASKAYAPFAQGRDGFVPGEGAAVFVLEELEQAKQRGTKILAEICGFGASTDGYHASAPEPQGRFAALAVEAALQQAGWPALDLVAAHATGTIANDVMEACLIERLIGAGTSVTALKSQIGHSAAACGALELALLLECLAAGFVPGIRNLKEPLDCKLDFVLAPRCATVRALLIESFGFGGQNAALVVKPWLN